MRNISLSLLSMALCLPLAAQTMPDMKENPLAAFGANQYKTISTNITKSIAKMPEDKFAFKPSDGVRTYSELVGHLINANYSYCTSITGGTKPENMEKGKSKAELATGWDSAVAECNKAWSMATDKNLVDKKKMGTREVMAGQMLFGNSTHSNEHYGNIVTYMRISGLVPPSSEK